MKIKNNNILIILLSVFIISSIFTYTFGFDPKNKYEDTIDVDGIEKILNKKYEELEFISNEIFDKNETELEDFFYRDNLNLYKNLGIGFFFYEDNELKYWTTNDIPVPVSATIHFFDNSVINLNNGWYMSYTLQNGGCHIVGLFQIKKEYSYENDNLSNYFWHELDLPTGVIVSTDESDGSIQVCFNNDGECFYLLTENGMDNRKPCFTLEHFLLIFNFLLLLTIIVLIFCRIVKKERVPNLFSFITLFIVLFILRYLMLKFNYFDIFYNFRLFSPELFAESFWLPSLGEYIVNVILFCIFTILFILYFRLNIKAVSTGPVRVIIAMSLAMLMIFSTWFISDLFYGLVWNSSISFEFEKVLNLSVYSFIGIVIIVTVIICFVGLFYKMIKVIKDHISMWMLIVSLIIGFSAGLLFHNELDVSFYSFLIFSLLFMLLWIFISYVAFKSRITYLISVLMLVLISLITSEYFSRLSNRKELDAYKVITYNLAAERDPSAEFFLKQVYYEIQNDERLSNLISRKDFTRIKYRINNILLSKRYFNKYETQTTVCSSSDSLMIQPDMVSVDCFEFFRNQIEGYGVIIPSTNFYFLDNHNGRISYMGEISTLLADSTYVNIYIELNSKIFSEGLGYPELLLDKKLIVKKSAKDYNYAKYNKGTLISSKGDYKYQFTLKADDKDTSEYSYYLKDGYVHFRYRPDEDNIIILSKPDTQYSNELVSFTYVFAILFILFNLLWLIVKIFRKNTLGGTSLRTKTQISYITILFLSLIATGGISIYFIVQGYKQKQRDTVQDKVYSVIVELEQNIGEVDNLEYENLRMLNSMLIRLSNVFYTDINIYDLDGLLFSSSRIELYDKGLKGRYMDNRAYYDLIINNSGAMIIDENIDNVNYLSAYVPFRNFNNKVIAYINLPYFARQSEFSEEISSFVIAFSNIFLVLILISVSVGLFISRQLTKPLVLIREKIKAMDLKSKTEKIVYARNDEIGGLIREYNRKVDELSESANKLAQSERETAWREMAKQIAHEIKNPLTPMKLSVQHLERAYDRKDENWEGTFKKVSKTLIEQIDTLSRIASEFSNFAQMPDSYKNRLDLRDVIYSTVELFKTTGNVDFKIDIKTSGGVWVNADKEQMLRVFNNLIKNGIQAIPDDKKGKIIISVEENGENYIIKVIDNGSGISEDMIPKMFQPNFTTKSAGMGLGLSMVKNMLLSNNAIIYFNTEQGIGTEFIIEIPRI